MLVDNGFVNDLNKFHTELQSHSACLQAPTPKLRENTLRLLARHHRAKRRQISKVIPGSILNFCKQMKRPEEIRIHGRD
jgi:hypothetical protein